MLTDLSFADAKPTAQGKIKCTPEDFFVEEVLSFTPCGEGEHLYLFLEKKLLNTEEVSNYLARFFSVSSKLVSYAGMKDKYAQTRQWFSIHLPGKSTPNLESLESENIHILQSVRHNKKLKIGAVQENYFEITIQEFNHDVNEFKVRINNIHERGVPNYFGAQRFGNHGSNLLKAEEMLLRNKKIKNPHLRGIYYSAARAFLFNQILSLRIKHNCWDLPVAGDLMMLSGTHSVFLAEEITEEIIKRVKDHDIHPAAPLWGEGKEMTSLEALSLQTQALEPWKEWCVALEKNRLNKQYRAMVVNPRNLQLQNNKLTFTLPSGSFATSVLRELVYLKEEGA
ncbi:hydrogenase [Legionella adelaidensis]|uniref:tRNA pseudouridine synthase D n=1 Tax=Legionella adelaidensis TaxID=45056 RepID=A0A0W0R6A6_9GAMM|nr:tRNA pseudouridine(13) synthase TruD [Legionella adelaidensis]KTC66616.1 hydrogenase [Legionella adelaidensis]VEH81067.1 hydrogenase [Legionella adelaidensis]